MFYVIYAVVLLVLWLFAVAAVSINCKDLKELSELQAFKITVLERFLVRSAPYIWGTGTGSSLPGGSSPGAGSDYEDCLSNPDKMYSLLCQYRDRFPEQEAAR
jgi:hypothetical protein